MDWNKLRVFYYVAKAKSFTLAAKKLGISTSVVNRQVHDLEQQLGTKLVERHFRGIYLTDKGDVLFQSVRTAYRELELAEATIKGDENKLEGAVRIASTIGLASYWLPDYIPGFLERYPNIHLHIVSHTDEVDLQARDADLAICPALKQDPELEQVFLKTFDFKLYASPEYLKKFGTPKTLKDLSHHHLIAFSPDLSLPFAEADSLLHKAVAFKDKTEPFLQINTDAGLLALAEKGLGIVSLYSEASYLKNSPLVEVLPDEKEASVDIFYIYPKKTAHIKRITAFCDYLTQTLAADK